MTTLTDRQQILLAVLNARGPAHPRDLAYHPILRDLYGPGLGHFDIEDDLDELVDAGTVVAYLDNVSGETATVAYDVVGVNRPDWESRYQRAVRAHREQERRATRRTT